MTTSMGGCCWTSSILDPSGQTVASCSTNCNAGSNFIEPKPLTTQGTATYTVQFTSSVTGTATITLYNVPADLVLSAQPTSGGGTAVQVPITTPGQNARITFQGGNNQRFSWGQSGSVGAFGTTLLDPVNVQRASCGWNCNGGSGFLEPYTLQLTGTWTVGFDPAWAYTGTETIKLYNVPADLLTSATPTSGGGTAVPLTISTPGQNAKITFNARDGERVSWTHSGQIGAYGTTLNDPNNNPLISCGWNCNAGSAFLEPYPLTAGGYSVKFDPSYDAVGTETIKLYDVPPDATATAIPGANGTATATVTVTTPGQNGRITLQGYKAQTMSWTQSESVGVFGTTLYDPDGLFVASCGWNCNGGSEALGPTLLSKTGVYRIAFDPSYERTGYDTITLHLTPGFAPKVTGLANVGETMTAYLGAPSPPATSLTYQWQRCDLTGASCVNVDGQTSSTYDLSLPEYNKTLRVQIRGTNQYGTTSTSALSIPVIAPVTSLMLPYRPSLLFNVGPSASDSEWWRPLEITRFLTEQWPDTTYLHRVCDGFGSCIVPLQASFEAYDTPDAYVDIDNNYSSPYCHTLTPNGGEVFDCDSGPRSAMYLEPGQDSAAYRYLDYWWFYRGNHPGGTVGEIDDHEGDWEGVTVVLDGINPSSLSVAYAYYAAHQVGAWYLANALPSVNGHVVDYVARGTHASYPFSCTDNCTPPPGTGWNYESPHDGGAPWGNNDDVACASACVQRYPENPPPFPESWWGLWQGRWGESPGYIGGLGTSPRAPEYQSRFYCATAGYDATCSRPAPPRARQPQTSQVHGTSSPRVCRSWFGSGVAVLACDPVLLRHAIRTHRMRQRGSLHLRVQGRRSGDSPGLAQVIGEPLRVGEAIHIRGRTTARTILIVGVRIGQHLYRAELGIPKLSSSGQLELRIGSRNARPILLAAGIDQHAEVTRRLR